MEKKNQPIETRRKVVMPTHKMTNNESSDVHGTDAGFWPRPGMNSCSIWSRTDTTLEEEGAASDESRVAPENAKLYEKVRV